MVSDYIDDKSLVMMESERGSNGETTKYISMKGIGEDGPIRTAGIVSNYATHYGFYVVKFRFRGLDTEDVATNKTIWHPSVWSGKTNHVMDRKRAISATNSKEWTEIDFMEWSTSANSWDSDAPSRFTDSKGVARKVTTQGEDMEKAVMRSAHDKVDSNWHTIGLEYTPEILKLWRWEDNQWVHIGDRVVTFVDDDTSNPESQYTRSTISKKARSPQFWVLGNVVSRYLYPAIEAGTTKYSKKNMAVDFDYFRYYPHEATKSMNWRGKYQK